jgi:hypothetical protein
LIKGSIFLRAAFTARFLHAALHLLQFRSTLDIGSDVSVLRPRHSSAEGGCAIGMTDFLSTTGADSQFPAARGQYEGSEWN